METEELRKTKVQTPAILALSLSLLFSGVVGALIFFTSSDEDVATPAWVKPTVGSIGDHRGLVILTYPSGTSVPTYSAASVRTTLNLKVGPYLNEVSRGKMTLRGVMNPDDVADIVGWVPYSGVVIKDGAMTAAKAAQPGLVFKDYSWIFFVYACSSCSEGGTGGSYSSKSTPEGYSVFGDPIINLSAVQYASVWLHEMGHTFYFSDEGYFKDCGTTPYGRLGASCTQHSYKDSYDPMGGGTQYTPYYHAVHRDAINWLRSGEVATYGLTETATKSFVLTPYESTETGLKTVRVERDANTYAYIEFRQPLGVDGFLATVGNNITTGALIHYGKPGSTPAFLIDADPTGGASPVNSGLQVGQSYTDETGHFRITVAALANQRLTISVMRI